MTHSIRTFAAIAYNEVLLNSKRVAPYVLMILFAGNALLWWGRGPAVKLGWATNSEYYIVRNLLGFSFLLGLPIFNAVIMSDSVIRDFRSGIDPLLFSKPISRGSYLFGKFAGNFIVLVGCQSVFILMLIVLQLFRTSQMVVQPFRVWPYFKHFFFYVVISHLLLAAFYFALGTLTRNAKIVYGLAVGFYPLYIAYQLFLLQRLPQTWMIILDPMLLNSGLKGNGFLHTAEFLNQLVIVYTPVMLSNRGLMILGGAVCLAIAYFRFSMHEPAQAREHFSTLSLPSPAEQSYAPEFAVFIPAPAEPVKLPIVTPGNDGVWIELRKLLSATAMELKLLRAERSLVVLLPLALVLCTLEVAFFPVPAEISYSASYASLTATAMLIFLIGFSVFYTGEAMHRDREINIEPMLWTTPVPNHVLILSKFLSTVLLLAALILSVGIAAATIQLIRQHTPIDLVAYVRVYGIILLPSALILTAISVLANVVLLNKYACYVVSIGTAASLFYLYSTAHNHWLYNPVLYRLWVYSDLMQGATLREIVWHRAGWLIAAIVSLALAHLFFERKSGRGAKPSI